MLHYSLIVHEIGKYNIYFELLQLKYSKLNKPSALHMAFMGVDKGMRKLMRTILKVEILQTILCKEYNVHDFYKWPNEQTTKEIANVKGTTPRVKCLNTQFLLP